MKEYTLRMGVNTLNKYGQEFEESDIYITENAKITEKFIIEQNTGEIIIDEVIIENEPVGGIGLFRIIKTFFIETSSFRRTYAIFISITKNVTGIMEVVVNSDQTVTLYILDSISTSGVSLYKSNTIFYHGFYIYALIGDVGSTAYQTKYIKFNPENSKSAVTVIDLTSYLPSECARGREIEPYYNYFMLHGDNTTYSTSDPHLLFWSSAENPEQFDNIDNNAIGNNDERIVRVINYNGYLFIFKQKSIWIMTGASPEQFNFTNLTKEFGLYSSTSICVKNNLLMFIDDKLNFRVISGTKIDKLYERKDIERLFIFENNVEGR